MEVRKEPLERYEYDQLLLGAKYKPGDVVWTNGSVFGPWPGKVVYVSDYLLNLYPKAEGFWHYVELYNTLDRNFYPEDELLPFNDKENISAPIKRAKLLDEAMAAAKEENTAKRSIESQVDIVPPQSQFEKTSTFEIIPKEDLMLPDGYELSEIEPMDLNIENTVPNVENISQTTLGIEAVPLCSNIVFSPNSEEISESSLHSTPGSLKFSTKRKIAMTEKCVGPRNAEQETLVKSIDNVPKFESNIESSGDDKPTPLDISIESKIPKIDSQTSVSGLSRKSRKRTIMKSTVQKGKSNDVPVIIELEDDSTDKSIEEQSVSRVLEMPCHDQSADKTIGEQSVSRVLEMSSHDQSTDKTIEEQFLSRVLEMPSQDQSADQTIEEQSVSRVLEMSNQMELEPVSASDQNLERNVGFLGYGGLGKIFVRKLVAFGHEVILWNRSITKCYELIGSSVKLEATPELVVQSSNIIFCCVTDTDAVQQIYYHYGVQKAITKGKRFVVLTAIHPLTSLEIEQDVTKRGGVYLESPLFPTAGDGTEVSFVAAIGGDPNDTWQCLPYFQSFIKDPYYVGKVPVANKLMLLLKSFSAVQVAAFAESMALAKSWDVPSNIFVEFTKQTQIASTFLIPKTKAMLDKQPCSNGDGFQLGHFSDALSSTLDCMDNIDTPVISASRQVYLHSKAQGHTDKDISAVYRKYISP